MRTPYPTRTAYSGPPPNDYMNPDWGSAGKVHEWKNYINHRLQVMWDTFTPEQKAAIAASADEVAGREEWD